MAESSQMMGWEWRAGRELAQRAGLRIVKIQEEGGGPFGLGRSPSLGAALPDAQKLEAEVIAVDRSGQASVGARIKFRIPKAELRGVGVGEYVAIGVVGDKVVCLAPAPSDVRESSLARWLTEAHCN